MIVDEKQLSKSIDHTNLKADATEKDIKKLCEEAIKYNFASVFVHPSHVKFVSALLGNSAVRVGTVVSFPHGATTTTVKCFETINNVVNGAEEIDFVINIGYLKAEKYDELFHDIKAVVMSANRDQLKTRKGNVVTKAIIECGFLTDKEIKDVCKLIFQAGVDFAKTSTGLGPEGATVKNVKLIRRSLPSTVGVKASGGIRTADQAVELMLNGANRIGTSTGVQIIKEFNKKHKTGQNKK